MWKRNVFLGIDRELWPELLISVALCLFFITFSLLFLIPIFSTDVHIAGRIVSLLISLFLLFIGSTFITVPSQIRHKTQLVQWHSPEQVQVELTLKDWDETGDADESDDVIVTVLQAGKTHKHITQSPYWNIQRLLNQPCEARLFLNREGIPSVVQLHAGRIWLNIDP